MDMELLLRQLEDGEVEDEGVDITGGRPGEHGSMDGGRKSRIQTPDQNKTDTQKLT